MTEFAALWKMRRLYPRLRRAAERRPGDPTLSAGAQVAFPTLQEFCDAYDAASHREIPWMRDGQSGRAAAYDLVLTARMWLPLCVRDLPGAERANYLDSAISDDLSDDTEQLITLLRDGRQSDGSPVAYRENAVDALDVALRTAHLKWDAAEVTGVPLSLEMST